MGDYQYPGVSSTQNSVLAQLLCRYPCWGTISTREYHPPSIQYQHGYCVDTSARGLLVPGGIIHPVFSTGMVIVSIPLLQDYQYPGYHPPSIQYCHCYCVDTSAGGLLVPEVSSTQNSVLAQLLCRYPCWGTISTRGYHPPSIQYQHGYCVDTSARGLLVPGGIIHPVFSTGMVIVSITLLQDYQYPGYHPPSIQYCHGYCVDTSAGGLLVPEVSSTQYSVLAWLLCRYLCWGTISTLGVSSTQYSVLAWLLCRYFCWETISTLGYHPPSIQYWHGYCVDTSAEGLLVPGGIIHPVFSTGMVIVSIPLLGDYQDPGYHPPSIQYWHGYCVDTSIGGLLAPGVSSTQYSVLAWLLCQYLCWGTISTRGYHPPSIQYWHGYCVDTSAAGLLLPGVSSTQYSVVPWLLCRYLCWGTISTRGIIHPVFSTGMVIVSIPLLGDYQYPGGIIHPEFSTGMVIVSIPLLGDYQYPGYHPPSIQYWHGYCVDTSRGDYQHPGVSSTQYSVLAWLLCRYLCWGTISPRGINHPVFSTGMVIVSIPLLQDYQYPGYHPPSIQYCHGYCVDTSAGGLLVPGVSSTQYSVLAWLLCRYLCWGTISTLGYHPPSIQYWHGYCVDSSAGRLLVPWGIIHPLFSTGMVIVPIPLLGGYQ